MSLATPLLNALHGMAGFCQTHPQTILIPDTPVTANSPGERLLALDLTAVDRLSCSFQELRLQTGPPPKEIAAWARTIQSKVTYLLEPLTVIEFDRQADLLQMRSTKPETEPTSIRYYEVNLTGTGELRLNRYTAVPGKPGREAIDLCLTLEVLKKLVIDLEASATPVNLGKAA